MANPDYIEVTPVVTGGLKRAGTGKGIELLPTDIETALEKFEATQFRTQEEVLRQIRKLGYQAVLADFPFGSQRVIEKSLKSFEFKLAIKKKAFPR